ncbi:MAG: sigma-54-dependent transcriptional regulator, partial [Phycisphaerae bacterium]
MAEILVIEDEPILARNVCESLDLSGHAASSAPTGEEGLETAQSCFPDLILLDYRLPGIDGLEVIRELRKVGNQSSIIMMTAHGNIDTAVEAMKRGASDFLTKPLDLTELRLVIERVLDHRAARAQLSYFHQREKTQSSQDQIVGDCKPLSEVKDFITRITSTQALASQRPPSILITGET